MVTIAAVLAGCSNNAARTIPRSQASPVSAEAPASGTSFPVVNAATSSVNCSSSELSDQAWARCALDVLSTVEEGVKDYHDATALSRQSVQAQILRQQAYGEFNSALAAGQALWPATQQVRNATARDDFVFVLGNIGGFMHPTPDLPGDPNGPTLGDRVARSLQNAITTSAALQPRLQRLEESS